MVRFTLPLSSSPNDKESLRKILNPYPIHLHNLLGFQLTLHANPSCSFFDKSCSHTFKDNRISGGDSLVNRDVLNDEAACRMTEGFEEFFIFSSIGAQTPRPG